MKKYTESIKENLGKIFTPEKAQEIFDANFPKVSKQQVKLNKDRERILQILDAVQYNPNRVTDKMVKDAWRISGLRISKSKKKKTSKK